MKIGLLAYHSACNFGATLQLLSSYMYWKNAGHEPIVINWIPEDLEQFYKTQVPKEQWILQENIRKVIWKETALCRTDKEVAQIIQYEHIDAVVVGSDAVAQHHTMRERMVFPCRRILYIRKVTSDRMFPHNPFWGSFNAYLPHPIPVAVLSASSQDSQFHYYSQSLMRQMLAAIERYAFISVRDSWTRDMIANITGNNIVPPVTPDPVFAFNDNVKELIPSKETLCQRYHLPEKYILFSFIRKDVVNQEWIDDLEALAEKKGIALVSLPFAHCKSYGESKIEIPHPLSPIDWYALIKYSQGYIGNNMHPIVVSLHNAVPFFSFDNYGVAGTPIRKSDDSTSKILHILGKADLLDYRVSCLVQGYKVPSADHVFQLIDSFPSEKAEAFAKTYNDQYIAMMKNIKNAIAC